MIQPTPAAGSPAERTCGNCACSQIIRRPKVQPPDMDSKTYDQMPAEQMVCRFNPPLVVQTPKGRALMQMPTDAAMVCFNGWRKAGTLPGD